MTGEELKKLRKLRGITQEELSAAIGIPKGTIGRIESNRDEVVKKVDVLDSLLRFFSNEANDTSISSVLIEPQNIGIPMWNMPGAASNVEMYGDPKDVKIIGYLNIPGATKDSFALPVHGNSMYPTLESGSWCVLRPINDSTDIVWGEIYYIEWGDYRMFKRLLYSDNTDDVILWSDNQAETIKDRPRHSPITIKKERIKKLCLLTDILKKPNY